jgi:photosystem II stability/assembly factor-like uncharacterized protein
MPTITNASQDFAALKWRCIGPSRGGRVVAVAGDFNDRMTFYFGACAGGVWKTSNGGVYWRCVTDGFLGTAAIGALAVARSDSNIVYAGTGETTIRLDVSYGDGIYKSDDAGQTWRDMGLKGSKHIGRICIHPTNPDIVYVAALGDIFGPHPERGVFRTRDGGVTWENILFRDAESGAIDMSMDPSNPRILFASTWQTRRNFWNISSGGPGSALYRSNDGGDTWEDISAKPGLPGGMLGKIGVTISPARSGRVWALVEAEGDKTGLYRSDNGGESWTQVSSNRDLMHRPWYYTHVFADPVHAETVYVTNLGMWKSTDGGVSFSEIMTPHGDNHDLWIDPQDPQRMIEGNDGGACVSFNGGLIWSSIYNQLTAQFYRIDIDDQYPYRVYGTQQDNTSISVPSAAVWGAITLGDCTYPGTGESGFIAVHPKDHNIVYVGAIGSSPGGAGALQRYDYRTDQIQLVNVWPEESTGIAPRDLRYRFAWTFPIVFSPHDSNVLYAGGNHVFRTRDEGMSWQEISPDLSLNDLSRQGHSGGEITRESAGAEVHATCACVVENPHRKGEIWASTDDGLVHVTRDDGASWTNVTPPGMPELAYVGCIEISAHDPATVYVAATRYKLSDYEPYLFRSTDSGANWVSVNGDFPSGEITRVIRADSVRAGLLFVGTESGVFFSLDDGACWNRLPGGLPIVPVYDLKLKGADLVAGTHGRSFWVLDDITPLREFADGKASLVTPRPAIRTKLHFGALGNLRSGTSFGLAFGIGGGITTIEQPDGTKKLHHLDVGENPPNGAIVYYRLGEDAGPVKLRFADAAGTDIISFASDDTKLGVGKRPTAKPGLNRFVWDLRHPGPDRIDASLVTRKNKPLAPESDGQAGPTTVPGTYAVTLSAGGENFTANFTVVKDKRVPASADDYARQFALLSELNNSLSQLNNSVNRIRRLKQHLAALEGRIDGHAEIGGDITAVTEKLSEIEGVLVDVHRQSPRDALRNPAGLNDTLVDLINTVSISDSAPTAQAEAVSRGLMRNLAGQVAKLDNLVASDIAGINKMAAGLPVAQVVG